MDVGGPPALEGRHVIWEAGAGDVVGQRVVPDIDSVIWVVRERDAPAGAGAADREVAQPFLEPAQDLVAEMLGLAERGVLSEELLEPLLVLAESEEPVLLLEP